MEHYEEEFGLEATAVQDPATVNESAINHRYAEIADLKSYLTDTDYMLMRQLDGGEPMPEEVKTRRAEARARINVCEAEIAKLMEG
jgi:hypothetical protein